jgi:hypothetical protein
MYDTDSVVVPGVLGSSALIILWWVSLWLIAEETIEFLSGNKRHIKLSICVIVIVIITVYAHMYPKFAIKL